MIRDQPAKTDYPGRFLLSDDVRSVTAYLSAQGWLHSGERIECITRAGPSNMNCVLRVVTTRRTFILKQSRPWVEKYPDIPAPWDRALTEARFYSVVERVPSVAGFLPRLLAHDPEERLLMLEDLGPAQDFTPLYLPSDGRLQPSEAMQLIDFLVALHRSINPLELDAEFSNQAMRALNHEHIFALPLRRQNGLNLDGITPGLTSLAQALQENAPYVQEVSSLGALYCGSSPQSCLLHGDYFPGSWLKARQRVYVIDPEFCFCGPPEWDLGVMIAHLYLMGASQVLVDLSIKRYGASAPLNQRLVYQFAGVEIMRRLVGVAQLPTSNQLEWKAQLLRLSRILVTAGLPG